MDVPDVTDFLPLVVGVQEKRRRSTIPRMRERWRKVQK